MIEGLSLSVIMSAVSVLGLPGLVLIFWYVDQRRYERDRKEQLERDGKEADRYSQEKLERLERDKKRDSQHQAELALIKEHFAAAMALYDKRFEAVVRMYENNVLLVKNYDRCEAEKTNIILMSTQILTKLVERVESNRFCPIVREKGGEK